MSRNAVTAISSALILTALGVGMYNGQCCTCKLASPPLKAMKEVDVVFSGLVESIREEGFQPPPDGKNSFTASGKGFMKQGVPKQFYQRANLPGFPEAVFDCTLSTEPTP